MFAIAGGVIAGGAAIAAGATASTVIGAAALGASVGGMLGSSKSTKDANEAAIDAATDSTSQANALQKYMYDQNRSDQGVFYDPSSRAMATLQSSIYGGKFGYGNGKTATYKPQESEGFKYTKSRTIADLGRQLRLMGRGSGSVAANAMGRTLGELNANNEETQRNELWNLVKTGQGAAGDIQTSGTNYANTTSSNLLDLGNVTANAEVAKGQSLSNLYGGLGSTLMDVYGINKKYS